MPKRNRKTKSPTLPTSYEPGFLSKLDGRTDLAKGLQAAYVAIVDDLGGEAELTHVKHSLVERFVFLEAVLGGIESQIAQARSGAVERDEARKIESELLGKWVQAVNSLQGLAKVLGVERKLTHAAWLAPASAEASS